MTSDGDSTSSPKSKTSPSRGPSDTAAKQEHNPTVLIAEHNPIALIAVPLSSLDAAQRKKLMEQSALWVECVGGSTLVMKDRFGAMPTARLDHLPTAIRRILVP